MQYEVVIGLEIHNELKTQTKIFCGCINKFGGEPNTHCCPVCLGHPGVLPRLNKQAVEYAVKAGIALNCNISKYSRFDRKNYFYPDLPKAYQTTQLEFPICKDGYVEYKSPSGDIKGVRIHQIHLEEDAGKLIHDDLTGGTLVDYNRGGVPLIEIVTEPDLRSPEDAVAFLETVRNILKYTGVSDCRMQEGSLRCDVNLSLMEKGSGKFGTRTEMKNLNSFKAAHRAMLYEIRRQTEILNSGGEVLQETRRWDDAAGKSFAMRSKEDAHDYRYFPDPDLLPVVLTGQDIERMKSEAPELPLGKKNRYIAEFGLSEYDADVLVSDKEISDFYDACAKVYTNYKALANFIMGDVLRKVKEIKLEDIIIPLNPVNFCKLLQLYDSGEVGQAAVKTLLDNIWDNDADPAQLMQTLGLKQISDVGELSELVKKIVADNPQPAADYRGGNKKALAFFVGQLMKATKGKANPAILNQLLTEELDS